MICRRRSSFWLGSASAISRLADERPRTCSTARRPGPRGVDRGWTASKRANGRADRIRSPRTQTCPPVELGQHQRVDRTLADIGRDVDAGADFEAHDQLVTVGTHPAHGLVARVEGFFGEDFRPWRVLGPSQPRPEAASLEVRRHTHAESLQERRGDVDVAHHVRDHSTLAEARRWPAPQQRHLNARVIQRAFGAWHGRPVIGGEDDARGLSNAELVEPGQDASDASIHLTDRALKRCQVLA